MERYFARIHLRREDVSVASVAIISRQAISVEGLANSSFFPFLLWFKPVISRFNFALVWDENIKDLIPPWKG